MIPSEPHKLYGVYVHNVYLHDAYLLQAAVIVHTVCYIVYKKNSYQSTTFTQLCWFNQQSLYMVV